MILIIGGRAAGKRHYALRRFGLEAQEQSMEQALHAPLVPGLHQIIRELQLRGEDVDAYVARLMAENPDAVVLCDEVGMGIVPLAREDRAWREAVGRACVAIAMQADEVVRIVCGLPQRIK